MATLLKVMVVDDTITYRMIMKKVAESIPGVQVTATASNGRLALDKIASQVASRDPERPDVVLLDVEMPVMDGLSSLKEIGKRFPQVTVIMVSGLSRSNANIVLECLNAGALDFITKPIESNVDRAKAALRQDLEPILSVIIKGMDDDGVKGAGSVGDEGGSGGDKPDKSPDKSPDKFRTSEGQGVSPVKERKEEGIKGRIPAPVRSFGAVLPRVAGVVPAVPRVPVAKPAVARGVVAKGPQGPQGGGPPEGAPDLVLVGSSTGGPAALTRLLGRIGGVLPVPMLIVQHMPPIFTASLAAQLSRTSGLDVREAQDGQLVEPGGVVIAQGGRHMTVISENRQLRVVLNDGPKVNECRPAVDVLFMSAMAGFSGRILAVVLTGMGRDGANGVDALKRSGRTLCITQDQKTCVVYGMPRSVDEKGLSDLSLPLDDIGPKIAELCGIVGR